MRSIAAWFVTDAPHTDATRADIEAELESHIELAVEALVADGAEPGQARVDAWRRFGNMNTIAGRSLAVKHRGENTMKGIIALLAAALVLVTSALVLTTLEMRRGLAKHAALQSTELVSARRMDLPPDAFNSILPPILLGAHDAPRPGDRLVLTNNGVVPGLELSVRVDVDGRVLLPDIGRLDASKLSREGLEQTLSEFYAPFYEHEPKFTVSIERDRY